MSDFGISGGEKMLHLRLSCVGFYINLKVVLCYVDKDLRIEVGMAEVRAAAAHATGFQFSSLQNFVPHREKPNFD